MSTTMKTPLPEKQTRALILAAGEGTRLRPITLDRPKPMVPINGRPLLDYIVGWLRDSGIQDIAINLHYKPEVIVDHFGDGAAHRINLHYSLEDKILGTAGAARKIKSWVGNNSLLVVYGDVLTDLDVRQLLSQHANNLARDESTVATIALYHVPNPTEVGLVGMDETGRVNRFLEKPKPEEVFTDLANAGVCVIEPSAIDMIPENSFYDFGLHLFPKTLEAQLGIYGWVIPSDTYLLDIGSLEKYAQAQRDWRERAQIRSAEPIDELNV
jgi:mannose-1-phosphate guanylyltransferase/phosphomannomutase